MRKLLFFYAKWCQPCKIMDAVVDELISESGESKVEKIDVSKIPSLAEKFDIVRLPTIVICDGDKVVMNRTGGYTAEDLKALLED